MELIVFFTTASVGVYRGVRRPEGILSLSFIVSIIFIGFWGPQFWLLSESNSLPPGAISKTILMATLCLAMAIGGYEASQKSARWKNALKQPEVNYVAVTWWLLSVGIATLALLSTLPSHLRESRQPEGPVAMIAFLSTSLAISFGFALTGWMRTKNRSYLLPLGISAAFMLYRVFVVAKRTAVAEIALVVLGALWFTRGKRPPTWIGLVAVPGLVILLAFGKSYRHALHDGAGQWAAHGVSVEAMGEAATTAVERMDLSEAATSVATAETTNAAFAIEAKSRTWDYDLGTADLVTVGRLLLPRQLFGDLRDHIIPTTQSAPDGFKVFGYREPLGTPTTGIARAYEAFGYFGSLLFFAFSYSIGIVYRAARSGSALAMGIWANAVFTMANTISHDTNRFWLGVIRLIVLVVPALIVCRGRSSLSNSREIEV
ncbi:hypothetical protein [Posidoniimonas corsicana]|uniref:hypothetical protein n=1 Tax=Posidoniimonas corsicana TaxID=1938618 RepID=UPI0011B85216|nr:hypothetical protein [Posidoniimonas corsicana]